MKILVASVKMTPQTIARQPWFYIHSIAEALSKKGNDVWMLTDTIADWPEHAKIIFLENFRTFPRGIDFRLEDLLRKEGFDLLIWSTGLTDFIFQRKVNILKIPIFAVVTSPRYYFTELLRNCKALSLNNKFTRQFLLGPLISKTRIEEFFKLPNLKAVIFESKGTLNRYTHNNPDVNKAFVIPPPIPENFLYILKLFKEKKENQEDKYFNRILYYGSPISVRGIDTLIEAMPLVMKKLDTVKLKVLSRIEYPSLLKHEHRLRKLVEKRGIGSHVNIISALLTPSQIIQHLLSCRVVCLPFKLVISDVPITVLETLATGTPLITSDISGVSEFANKGSYSLIPPGDHRALAEAIVNIIKSNAGRIIESKTKRFLNNHTQEKFALSFDSILRKTL